MWLHTTVFAQHPEIPESEKSVAVIAEPVAAVPVVEPDYEAPPVLSAKVWWKDVDWLSNQLWRVRDEVVSDGISNQYVIDSAYGTFQAYGDRQLLERLREIRAIYFLRNQGAFESGGEGTIEIAKDKLSLAGEIIEDPKQVAGDLPRGARAILRRAGSRIHRERRKGNYGGEGPIRSLIGADGKKLELTGRLEIDPYSDNEMLQEELERISAVKALPSFGVGFVLPARRFFKVVEAGNAVRSIDPYLDDPSDLFVHNRRALREELGASKELTSEFLSMESATPAQQTMLIQALAELKNCRSRTVLIEMAVNTETRNEFDYFKRTAELLAWYNGQVSPIQKLEPFLGVITFTDTAGERVLPLAVDLAGWCEEVASIVSEFSNVTEGGKVALSGRATGRMLVELDRRGIGFVLQE